MNQTNVPNDASLANARPRLISVDDNIRTIGGHFFELATLLLEGAQELGFQSVLATNSCFDGQAFVNSNWPLARVFNTRRMVRWSLGVDGNSRRSRDLAGRPLGGTAVQNKWTQLTEKIGRPSHRPETMIRQWSDDLSSLLMLCKPTPNDSLLINTGDDFVMLALAAAMRRLYLPFRLRIDVIFHFAIYDQSSDRPEVLHQYGRQMNHCLDALKSHDVRLHATTESLASQMREANLRQEVNAIPYPTRPRAVREDASRSSPVKVVLAGLPRAEKGRESITTLLHDIDQPLLQTGQVQMSMQMPADNWESMVPRSLHSDYRRAVADQQLNEPDRDVRTNCLEIKTSNLSTDDYHGWLDSSDVGLFLYAPDRYVARCSGVLLEMMVRGVPVIVPDGCWLADQVQAANNAVGGSSMVGFIYQDHSDIPKMLRQFIEQREAIRANAVRHAATIAARHRATNTIHELGIPTPQAIKMVA